MTKARRSAETKRLRTARTIARAAERSPEALQTCSVWDCGRPTQAASGKGLSRRYCGKHVKHHARHGSAHRASYSAKELAPYLKAAEAWLSAHTKDAIVRATLNGLQGVLRGAGAPEITTRMHRAPARDKARVALARLRTQAVPPARLLTIALATWALAEDDWSIRADAEFRQVQIAKQAHRLAARHMPAWLDAFAKDSPMRIAPSIFPEATGPVLRELGRMIDHIGASVAERALPELLANKRQRFGEHSSHPKHMSARSSVSGPERGGSRNFDNPPLYALRDGSPPGIRRAIKGDDDRAIPPPVHNSPIPPLAVHLDPWLTASGRPLAALVAEVLSILPKARHDARASREAILGAIFANLIINPAIAVPMANHKLTRYDRRAVVSSQLKPTIDALEAAGLIVKYAAVFREKRTVIEAAPALRAAFARHGATASDIGREPSEEVIFLKKRNKREDDGDNEPFDTSAPIAGAMIDYEDTPASRLMREEVRAFNRFIAAADIRLEGDTEPRPFKPFRRIFATSRAVRFDLHGRLYGGQVGGWHQGLPREERHRIRINDEPVADLDYSNMHVRLAYAETGAAPPEGDLYAIPGLEAQRDGVKAAMSAMISRDGELKRLPPKIRQLFPPAWNGMKVAAAIKAHHPGIAHLFGKDKGVAYMFIDSQILMAVLLRLMRENIPALPMHDGIMVQQSARHRVKIIMEEEALRIAGVRLPVEERVSVWALPGGMSV